MQPKSKHKIADEYCANHGVDLDKALAKLGFSKGQYSASKRVARQRMAHARRSWKKAGGKREVKKSTPKVSRAVRALNSTQIKQIVLDTPRPLRAVMLIGDPRDIARAFAEIGGAS